MKEMKEDTFKWKGIPFHELEEITLLKCATYSPFDRKELDMT